MTTSPSPRPASRRAAETLFNKIQRDLLPGVRLDAGTLALTIEAQTHSIDVVDVLTALLARARQLGATVNDLAAGERLLAQLQNGEG